MKIFNLTTTTLFTAYLSAISLTSHSEVLFTSYQFIATDEEEYKANYTLTESELNEIDKRIQLAIHMTESDDLMRNPKIMATSLLALKTMCVSIPEDHTHYENIFMACSFADLRRQLVADGIIDKSRLLMFSDEDFTNVSESLNEIRQSTENPTFVLIK